MTKVPWGYAAGLRDDRCRKIGIGQMQRQISDDIFRAFVADVLFSIDGDTFLPDLAR
jgi:hypothetical protein